MMLASPATVLEAMAFARLCGVRLLEDWMCWAGWRLHIGCDRCVTLGPDAPCWGRAGCHAYRFSCGCADCAERQARDLAAQEARAA